MNAIQMTLRILLLGPTLFSCAIWAANNESLSREASWEIPTASQIQSAVNDWTNSQKLDPAIEKQVESIWKGSSELESPDSLLNRTVQTFALIDAPAKRLVDLCGKRKSSGQLPEVAFLSDEKYAPFFRNNLKLFYGQWLALNQLYSELEQVLKGLAPTDVADPSSLLFFQAVSHHRLLNKEASLPKIEQLLEHAELIPLRYATVARLMEADIKPLKEDSLDEVSRLMDNIKVRLGHGRAGTRVRKEEDDVIAKLDKMIEELEKRQQQQSSSSSSQGGNQNQSSRPMEDSMPGRANGQGNVDPKKLGPDAEWGDLPPKEREEALQRLSKDLPSHYRDVIEQYFQKLAKDEQ